MATISERWANALIRWLKKALMPGNNLALQVLAEKLEKAAGKELAKLSWFGNDDPGRVREIVNQESDLAVSIINTYERASSACLKGCCTGCQPILHNRGALRNVRDVPVTLNDLLDPHRNTCPTHRSLKEEYRELNKKKWWSKDRIRTSKLMAKLRPPATNSPCTNCITLTTFLTKGYKYSKRITRSMLGINDKTTVERLKKTVRETMRQQTQVKNDDWLMQIKKANPKSNWLLSSRQVELRLKIRQNMMKPRAILCHYNIQEIKNGFCQACEVINGEKIKETMGHIFFDCKIMSDVWRYYRENHIRPLGRNVAPNGTSNGSIKSVAYKKILRIRILESYRRIMGPKKRPQI